MTAADLVVVADLKHIVNELRRRFGTATFSERRNAYRLVEAIALEIAEMEKADDAATAEGPGQVVDPVAP